MNDPDISVLLAFKRPFLLSENIHDIIKQIPAGGRRVTNGKVTAQHEKAAITSSYRSAFAHLRRAPHRAA